MMKKLFSLFAALLFVGSMWGASINLTPASGFPSSYSSSHTFYVGDVQFYDSGVMYNGKNQPSGYASKQLIQFRKSSSGAGEVKNNTALDLKSITIATQNNASFTLSAGTTTDNMSAVTKPSGSSGKYACKDNNDGDKEVDVTIYTFNVTGKKYFDILNGSSANYIAYITIELEDKYAISAGSVSNGSFSWVDGNDNTIVEPTPVLAGRSIKPVATPNDNYVFDAWDIYYMNNETKVPVALTDGKFAMPAFPVTISGSFRSATAPSIDLSDDELEFDVDLNSTPADGAQNIILLGENLTTGITLALDGEKDDKFTLSSTSFTKAEVEAGVEVTVTPTTDEAGSFENTITITWEGGTKTVDLSLTVNKLAAGLAWSTNEATAKIDSTNTLPTLSNEKGLAVTYSSNNACASFANENVYAITLNSAGTATITASFAGNDTYAAQEVSYTLIVEKYYTATWSVNGEVVKTQNAQADAAIASPADPASLGGKSFAGWGTAAIEGTTDTKPTIVTPTVMPANDVTYYAVFADGEAGSVTKKTDELDRAFTGVTPGTTSSSISYNSWENKTGTSGVVYAGLSAGGYTDNECIQLRNKNSNEGIITTAAAAGFIATKVTVTWRSGNSNNRYLDVYGKTAAYSAATDLYSNVAATQGTLLGSIQTNGETTVLNITGEYNYIGLRSRDGALYLTEIEIEWTKTIAPTYYAYATNQYAVTFNDKPDYGIVAVKNGDDAIKSGDKFWKGATLNVVTTPTSGYQLATLTAGGADIKEGKSFTIGTADVEVEATFSAIPYAITKAATENGSVTVKVGGEEATTATVGQTVNLTASPSSGYVLAAYDVYKTGESATKVTVTEGAFTMPAYPVTVSATFSVSTALDNTEAEVKAVKFIENGQMFIIKNGRTFNAQGQLVK